MFLPPTDNPQYNRLMGRLRHRLTSTSVMTVIVLWLIFIIVLSTFILRILYRDDSPLIGLYCCCGSGVMIIFSVLFGINSAFYVSSDCRRPSNDFIVISALSNQRLVHGYWRSMYDQLIARNLFPLVALPFIYGFVNMPVLLILFEKEPNGFGQIWTGVMVTIGHMGFYWFLTMLGLMLALAIRRSFAAIGTTLVLSILFLIIWVIANLVVIGMGSPNMHGRGLLFYCITLMVINLTPYLGLFIAWRLAIFSARYPFFHAWHNYQDRRRAYRYDG